MSNSMRLLGGVFFSMCMAVGHAKSFPTAPITLVVPYAAGGNLDVTTRLVAPFLSEELGVSVVVMNKPGAGGSVGASQVARAKPDGYTLLTTATTELSVTPHLTNAAYGIDSFELIGTVNTVPMVIEVTPEGKYQTIKALLDAACAAPDTVTMGIAGIGSVNFMGLRQLQEVTQCQFKMVPYNGSGPALLGVLGNQIDAIIDQVSSSKPYLETGRLKALVRMSDDPVQGLGDVPSLRQIGIQGADMATVAAFVAPKGLPPQASETLRTALRKVLHRPDVQQKISELGGVPHTASEDNFMDIIRPLDVLARKYKAEGTLAPQ